MKIVIITYRELPDKEWPLYVQAMKETGSTLTDKMFEELYNSGVLVINHYKEDKVITKYQITERDNILK
jgi:hypothetical protein